MAANSWPLDREGFVQHYIVSGPKVKPFFQEKQEPNLLRGEASLREKIARHEPVKEPGRIAAEQPGRLGFPWRFQGGKDCTLLNLSDFYSTTQQVLFDAATVLLSPEDREVSAVLWSYAAVDLYCNGELIGCLERPVYKPIQRKELCLPLKKGDNLIYLACETLGVRDTRSVVGLQIAEGMESIRVSLPEDTLAEEAGRALFFLEGMEPKGNRLRFPAPAPRGTEWTRNHGYEPDHVKAHLPLEWQPLEGQTSLLLPADQVYLKIRVPVGHDYLERTLERTDQIRPQPAARVMSPEENRKLVLQRIARIESFDRGPEFGFSICNLLARKYLGIFSEKDESLLEDTLNLIEQRVDCADFLVCGLIRYIKNYAVPRETETRIRQVLTHWRYWMDQDGFDGMCFWSENHCLMFYTGAMLAGEMYPEEFFPLAHKAGKELFSWGRDRIRDWLDDVEKYGFEEFHSTVYMCVTLAALLNVIDYAEPELSGRAARVTDQMLRLLAAHTFRGGIIAPQGRVYRGALYPFQAGAMALMNWAEPSQPWDLGEGWLAFAATSKYRFPEDMKRLMSGNASMSYVSGNARIVLEKQRDWCLTSVQIPREPFQRWKNTAREAGVDPSGHEFVKSFNECFHGTTCFQPGGYGYQQHLWYAALSGEAVLFANHPGSTSEGGDLRPGYWHGNGVFPVLKQEKNVLGMIWRIPENHPFHYVHLYAPLCRFSETRIEENWIFLHAGQGYIGFFSNRPLEPWDGMNDHCEARMWGDEIAGLCVCAGREIPDLETFIRKAKDLHPGYDPATGTLQAEGFSLTWTEGRDETQYLL